MHILYVSCGYTKICKYLNPSQNIENIWHSMSDHSIPVRGFVFPYIAIQQDVTASDYLFYSLVLDRNLCNFLIN